jgi:hypothetical protein
MPTSKKKAKAKKTYNVDPKKKLDEGLPWDMHIVIDPEVGYKIIAQHEKTGIGYKYLVTQALRKAHKLKD